MIKVAANIWDEVRKSRPLIHCITNYVTVNDVANVVLAIGASPAMCDHPDDAAHFVKLAGALYLNVGTLNFNQEQAMLAAAQAAGESSIPVLLDPVACGVIPTYARVSHMILETGAVKVIKGNAAEIKSLAGLEARASGVDSLDSGDNLEEACRGLHSNYGAVIVATGPVDLLTGSGGQVSIRNGTSLFQEITGAGCMAGGVIAACLAAAPQDAWLASFTGMIAFNIAGERAARTAGHNPGSFRVALLDHLSHVRGDDLIKQHRVEW